MVIMAVNGVESPNRIYNNTFTGTKRKKSSGQNLQQPSGSNLKKVPVVVMLAMSPAMLNSSAAENYMEYDMKPLTEVVADSQSEDENVPTIEARHLRSVQQSEYPLGVAFFSRRKVQEIKPAVGNGVKANLVLTRLSRQGAENDVSEVFYVDNTFHSRNNQNHEPPKVRELVYHDTGDGKEYLGIKILQNIYKSGNNTMYPDNTMEREVKLDDESAQFLLDLRTNDTKWNNTTDIKFSVTTNPKVMPPTVY